LILDPGERPRLETGDSRKEKPILDPGGKALKIKIA
jgi:hypothetical protein